MRKLLIYSSLIMKNAVTYLSMDFSCKLYEDMARALISSIVPLEQVSIGNAWMTGLSGKYQNSMQFAKYMITY